MSDHLCDEWNCQMRNISRNSVLYCETHKNAQRLRRDNAALRERLDGLLEQSETLYNIAEEIPGQDLGDAIDEIDKARAALKNERLTND